MMLTQLQLDALREIGNIGSGHAATALSTLLQRRISMSVPEVWLLPFVEVAEVVGHLEEPQAVIFLKAEGDIPGKAVFFFSLGSAETVVQILMGTDQPVDLLDSEMGQSALREVGNIMVGSFLIALSQFLNSHLYPSVPALAIDMTGAVLEGILLEEGEFAEEVLFIDTQLSGIPQIEGKFVFLPEGDSLTKMLGALGL